MRTAIVLASLAASCSTFSATNEAPVDAGTINDDDAGTDAGADAPTAADGGAYRSAVMADVPVAYWRFGEPSGATTAKDEIGVHDGLYQGLVTPGLPGATSDGDTAARFLKGSVQIGDAFDFANGAPFSFEAWLSVDLLDTTYRAPIYKRGDVSGTQVGWGVVIQSDQNGIALTLYGSPSSTSSNYASIQTKTFFHLVETFDGVSICDTYLDGKLAKQNTNCKTTLPETPLALVLGANSGGNANYFQGVLDEVALYDHVLSADRVSAHHAAR